MYTKTFKTYSYHRDVLWRIDVTGHFRTLGTLGARSAMSDRRKKSLAKRLFMRNVSGLLLAFFRRRKAEVFSNIIMAQSILRVPILPGAFFGHFSSCRSRWWGFVRKLLPGDGAFVNSSRRGYRRSFPIFHEKYTYSIVKNIFNTYALKRYKWFSLHLSLPHSIFCIGLRNFFPPSWLARTWRENN